METDLTKRPQSHIVPDSWQKTFLDDFAESGNKKYSATIAGISVRTVYNEINRNPEFAVAVEDAKQQAIMELHMEARRRALGEDMLDDEGNVIGRTRSSDKLLIFLLSSMSPNEYGIGAIQEAKRRGEEQESAGVDVKISLPENFRGKITIGREDVFPDATILDAEYIEEDSEEDTEPPETLLLEKDISPN